VETLSGEVTQQLLGVVTEFDDDVEEDTVQP
jgi:hypothetical protein